MHLRDADLLADLGLAELAEEAQRDDRPFPELKLSQQWAQRLALVDERQFGLQVPDETPGASSPELRISSRDEVRYASPACSPSITAVEVAMLEGVMSGHSTANGPKLGDPQALMDQLARLGDLIPAAIELGYHLCYGDTPGEDGVGHHFMQPVDTATLVQLANRLTRSTRRPISWIHMPVPSERDDDAYFRHSTHCGSCPALSCISAWYIEKTGWQAPSDEPTPPADTSAVSASPLSAAWAASPARRLPNYSECRRKSQHPEDACPARSA